MNKAQESITGKSQPAQLVTGSICRWLRFRFRLSVMAKALCFYRNPATAIRVLRGLISKKLATEGSLRNPKWIKADSKYYWNVSTPGLPSAAFDRYLRYEMDKIVPSRDPENMLQTMIMSITSRCPLKCEHCYEWNNLSSEETLSLADLENILRKFQAYGITNIQLSGGEPLSRFDDLIELLRSTQAGTDFWILTSGFGLSREKAQALKQAGLKGVVISLDHWKEEEHNRLRNHDKSYFWVFEAARNALAADLVVSLSLCASRNFVTLDNLQRYVQLAREHDIAMIRILEPRVVGHYQGQDIELGEAQIKLLDDLFLSFANDLRHRNDPVIEYVAYYQRKFGCFGAGDRYLYVDSHGDIHACPFCQDPVGNALTATIEESVSRLKETGCHKYQRIIPEQLMADPEHRHAARI